VRYQRIGNGALVETLSLALENGGRKMFSVIDQITIADKDVSGLTYKVSIVNDYDLTSPEGDGFTEKQVKAFSDDQWYYVGVMITPLINGDPIEMANQSLWGVEYGHYPATDEDDNLIEWLWLDVDTIRESVVPDLIDEARTDLLQGLGPKIAALQKVYAALVA
jgi:hypothetical protein